LEMSDWGMWWAASWFGTLVAAMIGGLLGDRYGVQKIVGLGVVLMGVTLVMRATASGFGSMYVWMFLFGVALALTFPNVPKALGMWFAPEEFGMANGVTQAGYWAGAALTLALAQTEQTEKARRHAVMREEGISELDAAHRIAGEITRLREQYR